MKVKALQNFVDLAESNAQEKKVLRTAGDVFIVSQERFDSLKVAGQYVEEVKTKTEPKK